MTDESVCTRCGGGGTEDIELSATVLGRTLSVSGLLTKTCERCDGTGELVETRPKRFDELSDGEVKALAYADTYRESGGKDEDEIKQEMNRAQSGRTPTAGPTPNVPSKPPGL